MSTYTARCSSKGWSKTARRNVIKHPLCAGARTVCEALKAPDPENKLWVEAGKPSPAMRRTFRKVWWDVWDQLFLKNEEKASPALFLLSWAEPAAWLGVLATAILHPAARQWELRATVIATALYSQAGAKKGSASRGRRGGGGQNTTDLVKETLKKYHTWRPFLKLFIYQSAVRRGECNKFVAHRELGVGGSLPIKKNGPEQRKRFC